MVEFDTTTTAVSFALLILIGVGGLAGSGMMSPDTVLMMVAPSMILFGGLCLAIGVKYGEHRATAA